MLQKVKHSRASRVVVAAAIVAMGTATLTATPGYAEDQGAHDPDGFYVFGFSPLNIIIFPFTILSRGIVIPFGGLSLPDDYEVQ